MTLTDFLLARIAEDEERAHGGSSAPNYPHYGDTAAEECVEMAEAEGCAEAGVEFLRTQTPDRVLAECEAKRRIVDRHSACDDVSYGDASSCPDMRDLALPYADHPEYREEWRP